MSKSVYSAGNGDGLIGSGFFINYSWSRLVNKGFRILRSLVGSRWDKYCFVPKPSSLRILFIKFIRLIDIDFKSASGPRMLNIRQSGRVV